MTAQLTSSSTPQTAHGVPARRADVLICGGGISGLALAAFLRADGLRPVVFERTGRPGGAIGTVRRDGFLFERGPNTILDKYDSMDRLLELAGLEGEAIRVPMRTQQRHLWFRGRLHRVPTGPLAFAATPLLPIRAKLALLREPFVPPRTSEEESVADFVTRRLGRPWLTNLITPVVTGIWAGDPERLCADHAFPVMKEMEADGGSLLRGAMRRMRRRRAEARAEGRPPRTKCLTSFRHGLGQLPEALAGRLGGDFRPNTEVTALRRSEDGQYTIETRNGVATECWSAPRVVIAADAAGCAGFLAGFDSELAAVLRSVPYNGLAVAGVGLRADRARLPEGFGFLAVRDHGIRILGAIVNSNFMPGRAPEGCAGLTIYIGGELDQGALSLAEDEHAGLVRRDLRRVLGWPGPPEALYIERWDRAIPQYDMRHGARLRQFEAAEQRHPGLYLAGNWRGGVSVGDRIQCSAAMAARIQSETSSPRTDNPS